MRCLVLSALLSIRWECADVEISLLSHLFLFFNNILAFHKCVWCYNFGLLMMNIEEMFIDFQTICLIELESSQRNSYLGNQRITLVNLKTMS